MAVVKETTINRYIGLSSDTKPTTGQCPTGSTFYEYDTGDLYITYNGGTNWQLKSPSLALAEDAAHASGDHGIMLLAVRQDAAAALAAAGDYVPLIVDASGRLHLAPLVAGDAVIGKARLVDSAGDEVTNATLNSVVVTNPTADNLKADANLQVGDADVGAANKVPVDDADTQTLLGGGLPAALAAGGGLKVEGVAGGVAQPVSGTVTADQGAAGAAAWKVDDADTQTLLAGGLPAALAAGGGLKVEGVAGGVAQPISVGGAVPGTITEADASKVAVTVAGHTWDGANWRRLTANNVVDAANPGAPSLWTQAVNLGYNGSFFDRLRTIAGSGAGLGVLKVGTMGELLTLAASAARTTGANGTAVTTVGWRRRYIVLLDVTVLAAGAGDLLNVYIDFSPDGTTWYNAVHFTQKTGTDAVFKEIAVLDPSAPGAVVIDVTSDAASGAVRPALFGPQIRARWAITDGGGGTQSFTFSVVAYAQ